MAISIVNTNTGSNTSTTAVVPTYGGTPTAGNLLICSVAFSSSAVRTFSTSSTGWGQIFVDAGTNGTSAGGVTIFTKIATGGDASPTINKSASCSAAWTIEEIGGVGSGNPVDFTATDVTGNSSSGTVTITGNQVTSTVANEFAYVVYGGRNSAGSFAWTGGVTASNGIAATGVVETGFAALGVSGSTLTPGASWSASLGAPWYLITTVMVKPPAVATGSTLMSMGMG